MSRVFRGLGLLVVERCGIVRRGGSCISAMCCLGCGTPCTSSTGQFHVSMLRVPLARGNAQGQTHSETSSNYLCTNDG
jgi:hypothetical protein